MCLKSIVWYLIRVKLGSLFISGVSQLVLVKHTHHLQYPFLLCVSVMLVMSHETKLKLQGDDVFEAHL
jgi:hypothetical protein